VQPRQNLKNSLFKNGALLLGRAKVHQGKPVFLTLFDEVAPRQKGWGIDKMLGKGNLILEREEVPMSENKKTVYLTVGPRGAGKSYYCKNVLVQRKGMVLISRDEIMMERYGTVHTSYGAGQPEAMEAVKAMLLQHLSDKAGRGIVLDVWNGTSDERKDLIAVSRSYGAKKVVALYFVTPVEYVEKWFWLKPGVAKSNEWKEKQGQGYVFFSKDAPTNDHELFHGFAADIDTDGFDRIIRINPLQLELPFG
jgi:predicted kinase